VLGWAYVQGITWTRRPSRNLRQGLRELSQKLADARRIASSIVSVTHASTGCKCSVHRHFICDEVICYKRIDGNKFGNIRVCVEPMQCCARGCGYAINCHA
jgi:hypothetical protein